MYLEDMLTQCSPTGAKCVDIQNYFHPVEMTLGPIQLTNICFQGSIRYIGWCSCSCLLPCCLGSVVALHSLLGPTVISQLATLWSIDSYFHSNPNAMC